MRAGLLCRPYHSRPLARRPQAVTKKVMSMVLCRELQGGSYHIIDMNIRCMAPH